MRQINRSLVQQALQSLIWYSETNLVNNAKLYFTAKKALVFLWSRKPFLLSNRDRSTRRKRQFGYAADQKNMLTHLCLIRAAAVLQKAFFCIHLIKENVFSERSALVNIFFELLYYGTGKVVINTVCCSSLLFFVGCQAKPTKIMRSFDCILPII